MRELPKEVVELHEVDGAQLAHVDEARAGVQVDELRAKAARAGGGGCLGEQR